MFLRYLALMLVSASLVFLPVKRAQAGHDAAAILGGLIVGGIIVNEVNKNNQRKRAAQQQQQRQNNANAAARAAQREQNKQVQAALNYFGYNVGSVDGVVGRQTRAGIARYQADMGFTADGRMDDYERDFLLTSQQRAMASANVAPYNSILAAQGRAGLLRTFRNEELGIAAVAPTPAPAPAPAPTPVPVPAATEPASLPEFNFGSKGQSISDVCNEINVLTAANGGVITSAARVTDADFALKEQFCLARTHAIAEATTIEATIPNTSSAQVEAQCRGLAQAVAPLMASLSTADPNTVISETSAFMKDSGQPMDRLMSGGKVCLGVGYRVDDPEMSLASAVLLASGGEPGYGELVGHQLREGFGVTSAVPAKGAEWMALALKAMAEGGKTVLGQSADRAGVLAAALQASGQSSASALPVFPSSSGN